MCVCVCEVLLFLNCDYQATRMQQSVNKYSLCTLASLAGRITVASTKAGPGEGAHAHAYTAAAAAHIRNRQENRTLAHTGRFKYTYTALSHSHAHIDVHNAHAHAHLDTYSNAYAADVQRLPATQFADYARHSGAG